MHIQSKLSKHSKRSTPTPAPTKATAVVVHLKPNALTNVRAWAKYMSEHRAEALQSLQAEGVQIESVFLGTNAAGNFLVYYMRATTQARAEAVARQVSSDLAQVRHEFRENAWAKVAPLKPLLDLHHSQM